MLKGKGNNQFINKMHPPLKGSQEIKNKTQKTAMHLMLNEEAEAKKSRLTSLLVQQLIGINPIIIIHVNSDYYSYYYYYDR